MPEKKTFFSDYIFFFLSATLSPFPLRAGKEQNPTQNRFISTWVTFFNWNILNRLDWVSKNFFSPPIPPYLARNGTILVEMGPKNLQFQPGLFFQIEIFWIDWTRSQKNYFSEPMKNGLESIRLGVGRAGNGGGTAPRSRAQHFLPSPARRVCVSNWNASSWAS